MRTPTAIRARLAVAMALASVTSRLEDRLSGEETGSTTLETVVIAAGLLALAVGLVFAIRTAVGHYATQIK